VRPYLAPVLITAFIPLLFLFAEGGAAVDGTVTDSVTNTGIGGVAVELTRDGNTEGTYTAQTDVAGAFHFADIAPGDYIASFEKHGYASLQNFPVTQPVHVAGTAVRLQADLAALTTLRGRVLDNSGHPVPEIIVEMSIPAPSYPHHRRG
jgi:protocatechuate 3,4-dioxygenase beta subunit